MKYYEVLVGTEKIIIPVDDIRLVNFKEGKYVTLIIDFVKAPTIRLKAHNNLTEGVAEIKTAYKEIKRLLLLSKHLLKGE